MSDADFCKSLERKCTTSPLFCPHCHAPFEATLIVTILPPSLDAIVRNVIHYCPAFRR
jgi:hypothetical protein